MKEEIGAHSLWHVPVLGTVHADTVLTTWLAMVVTLLFLAWVGNSYRSPKVTRRQTLFEGMINYVADLVYGTLGKNGEPFVPFFIALFIFLFVMNQFGLFPFKALGLPFGGSPTADLNTTVPYALMIFFMIQYVALRKFGISTTAISRSRSRGCSRSIRSRNWPGRQPWPPACSSISSSANCCSSSSRRSSTRR